MRPTTWATLLAVCLSVRGLDARMPAVARTVATSAAAKGGPWSELVSAHGPTQEKAQHAVLDKAYQRVTEYLRQCEPGLRRLPSLEELTRRGIIPEPSAPKLDNTEW